jgi:hypothetical protein
MGVSTFQAGRSRGQEYRHARLFSPGSGRSPEFASRLRSDKPEARFKPRIADKPPLLPQTVCHVANGILPQLL